MINTGFLTEDREPSVAEMESYLGAREELLPGDPYPRGWSTIRRCRHCGTPVAGGPTACNRCIWTREAIDRAKHAESVLRDAVESGRVTVAYAHHDPMPCAACGGGEATCNCPCGDHFCGCQCHVPAQLEDELAQLESEDPAVATAAANYDAFVSSVTKRTP